MSLSNHRWVCNCCGKQMTGLPLDLAYEAPATYDAKSDQVAVLHSDFCHITYPSGEIERTIRCVLHIPIVDSDELFAFGVWMSVSESSWNTYSNGFDSGVYERPACFGYVMNHLPVDPTTMLLHADVAFGEGDQRPVVWLHDADHQLVEAQRNGVDISQVEAWVASATRHVN